MGKSARRQLLLGAHASSTSMHSDSSAVQPRRACYRTGHVQIATQPRRRPHSLAGIHQRTQGITGMPSSWAQDHLRPKPGSIDKQNKRLGSVRASGGCGQIHGGCIWAQDKERERSSKDGGRKVPTRMEEFLQALRRRWNLRARQESIQMPRVQGIRQGNRAM